MCSAGPNRKKDSVDVKRPTVCSLGSSARVSNSDRSGQPWGPPRVSSGERNFECLFSPGPQDFLPGIGIFQSDSLKVVEVEGVKSSSGNSDCLTVSPKRWTDPPSFLVRRHAYAAGTSRCHLINHATSGATTYGEARSQVITKVSSEGSKPVRYLNDITVLISDSGTRIREVARVIRGTSTKVGKYLLWNINRRIW